MDEGGTLTLNFNRYNLIKVIENLYYDNLNLEIRTHSEWYYTVCVENFLLVSGDLEIKVGRK